MIKHITAKSPNCALYEGVHHLRWQGVEEPSRNGSTVTSPMPVMTTYTHPTQRVLVSALRDANPFFHLFEALWMLAGRNDLAVPQKFVSTFGQFSDDGVTLNGAYGYRWRKHFGYDQLTRIAEMLSLPGRTRRAVLSMWDGGMSLEGEETDWPGALNLAMLSSDVPCNSHAYFDTIGGKLNMTVLCRSNDIILGAYGANVVHMSMLLEYMCALTGLPMGEYRQFSNDFHIYTEQLSKEQFETYANTVAASDIYAADRPIVIIPMISGHNIAEFDTDNLTFFGELDNNPGAHIIGMESPTPFFEKVVLPMFNSWGMWKAKEFDKADELTASIRATDWRKAAQGWLNNRRRVREEKAK